MTQNINWITPLSIAIEKLRGMEENLGNDKEYCLNVLRKSILQNNSFDTDGFSDADKRAISRAISFIGGVQEDMPEIIFKALRENDNKCIIKEMNL